MEASSCEESLTILDRIYIKKKNEMVSRILLATHIPLTDFTNFDKTNKDCSFSSVSVEQYQVELI